MMLIPTTPATVALLVALIIIVVAMQVYSARYRARQQREIQAMWRAHHREQARLSADHRKRTLGTMAKG